MGKKKTAFLFSRELCSNGKHEGTSRQGYQFERSEYTGRVSEWFKVHPWKGCVQKCTAGSNPVSTAKNKNKKEKII